MQTFWTIWEKSAKFGYLWQVLGKTAIFVAILFFVLFPNLRLFVKQIHAYRSMDRLIQPTFNGIEQINQDIDRLLPAGATREHEYHIIQRYVYEHIPYAYDWDNWGNADYWPMAEEVWTRKREDCDGQAVLAVSILRSRGFDSAKLVGNIRHIWVSVGRHELMGPDKEQTLQREAAGRIRFTFPSADLLLGSMAIFFADFPAGRNLILFFTLMILCYHPCRNGTGFFALTTFGLIGFLLLKEWGRDVMASRTMLTKFEFFAGSFLLCAAVILSLLMHRILKRDA